MDGVCKIQLLSMKTPVFVDRQCQNQLLSMKSWVLVDRIQNNRDFTLSPDVGKMWGKSYIKMAYRYL